VTPAEERAAIYELAYREGIRVLEDQERTLDQLRVRMVAILGTATTVTAFLAGIVVKAQGKDRDLVFHIGVVVGVLLFAGVAWKCFDSLRPKREWHFNLSPKTIVDGYADHEQPATLAETHRLLALILQTNIDHNQVNLDWMQNRLLYQALVLLIIDIAWWACLTAKVA
jgi:hypothetical protein